MSILTQAITNSSSTDALVLPPVLGGASIAASGTQTELIDSDNVSPEYIRAIQDLVDQALATCTFAETANEEGDVLAAFNKAAAADVAQERIGVETFAAAQTAVITLAVPMADALYNVFLTPDALVGAGLTPFVTTKTATAFTIEFAAAFTGDVDWLVKAL